MKQGIARKIKAARKKARVLFARLNGLGMVGFSSPYEATRDQRVVPVNRYEHHTVKAGKGEYV